MNVDTTDLAKRIRRHVLRMTHRAKASHVGSCFSVVDILAVLYGRVMAHYPGNPKAPGRDRLILSKGHAAAALYATLAEFGYFPADWLERFCEDGSILLGHASHHVAGVEVSTGSLGHGLPIAVGMALAAKMKGETHRVFCILSDGELQEGSVWEAVQFAAEHRLGNLVAIVDQNGQQGLGKIASERFTTMSAWYQFGWCGVDDGVDGYTNGHDHAEIEHSINFDGYEKSSQPLVLLCETIKGKGVSFMEDRLEWHYKSVDDAQLKAALKEIV